MAKKTAVKGKGSKKPKLEKKTQPPVLNLRRNI
jgi:hypothetical protein